MTTKLIGVLASAIHKKTVQLLTTHNNILNDQHDHAISRIAGTISKSAYSDERTRIAIPLETGMGKSTIVKASLLCMKDTELSALVCVETVEQMKELFDDCIRYGLTEDQINMFHKKQGSDIKSIDFHSATNYQFLIVCHNKMYADSRKIQSNQDEKSTVDWMNTYRGKERSIVFWDERLDPKSCYTLFRHDIRSAIGFWLPLYEEKLNSQSFNNLAETKQQSLRLLGNWIRESNSILEQFSVDEIIKLPELDMSLQDVKLYQEYVCDLREGADRANEHIRELVKYSQIGQIRLIKANNQSTLIQFTNQIHDDFKKLVIFDATMPIRELSKYDKGVQILELPIRKDYRTVTLNVCPTHSSKSRLTGKGHQKELDKYYQEIEQVLSEIPATESLLVFTFKEIKAAVEEHFKKGKYYGRVKVAHWGGGHKATNRFSEIKYIFTLGVLRRNRADLTANLLGAKDSLFSTVSNFEIQAIEHTEMADMLVQAFGRGYNRKTHNGVAGETTIYLYLPEKDRPVIDAIKKAMNGIITSERNVAKHFDRNRSTTSKTDLIADGIGEIVARFDNETISIQELRESYTPKVNSQDKTWARGLKRFLENNRDVWCKQGKTITSIHLSHTH